MSEDAVWTHWHPAQPTPPTEIPADLPAPESEEAKPSYMRGRKLSPEEARKAIAEMGDLSVEEAKDLGGGHYIDFTDAVAAIERIRDNCEQAYAHRVSAISTLRDANEALDHLAAYVEREMHGLAHPTTDEAIARDKLLAHQTAADIQMLAAHEIYSESGQLEEFILRALSRVSPSALKKAEMGTARTQAEYKKLSDMTDISMQERFEQMRVWAEKLEGWLRASDSNATYLESQLANATRQNEELKRDYAALLEHHESTDAIIADAPKTQ